MFDFKSIPINENTQDISEFLAKLAPNNVLQITEYNSDWLFTNGTTISADPDTDTFTTITAHGLSVGDPVEFDANGGTLPAGLSAYNSDAVGGTYYNVATVADTTHFTVTATVGSTTPLNITSAGAGTWRVRKAGMASFDITGLDLLRDGAYEINLYLRGALINATGSVVSIRANNDGSAVYSFHTTGAWTDSKMHIRAAQTKKYGKTFHTIGLTRISASSLFGFQSCSGSMSDDKSTSISVLASYIANPDFYVQGLAAEVTSIRVYLANAANMLIRNGALVVVRRIN